MIVSFISLTTNSAKLYFSQRLGKFLTVDASIRVTLYVLPAITLHLLMPLFYLIVMAAYLKGSWAPHRPELRIGRKIDFQADPESRPECLFIYCYKMYG